MEYKDVYRVDWKKVLGIETYKYESLSWVGRFRLWLKLILQLFFRLSSVGEQAREVDFLFVKSLSRGDYDKLYADIASCCPEEKLVEDIIFYRREGFRFLRLRLKPFLVFIKYLPLFIIFLEWNLARSVYMMTYVLRCLDIFEKINKNISFKNLVVFADMQPIDNFLVQVAKLNGIPTVTLQHGLYIDYTKMENVNSLNYKNHVSDYFLAWGDSTKYLIEKFNPDARVVICGKPIQKIALATEKKDYFSVLFDQNLLKMYNAKLLEMAYELHETTGLKVNIRFHPYNKMDDYQIHNDASCFDEDLESSVFILAHTTSLIHELLRKGFPVFKLISDVPALSVPAALEFSSVSELEAAIRQSDLENYDFEKYGKEYIRYINDMSLDKYAEFFSTLQNA